MFWVNVLQSARGSLTFGELSQSSKSGNNKGPWALVSGEIIILSHWSMPQKRRLSTRSFRNDVLYLLFGWRGTVCENQLCAHDCGVTTLPIPWV